MPKLVSTRDLKHRVEVGQLEKLAGYSRAKGSFKSSFDKRCKIDSNPTENSNDTGVETPVKTIEVAMRFDPRMKSVCAIKFKGVVYEINSVENVEERDHTLILQCDSLING